MIKKIVLLCLILPLLYLARGQSLSPVVVSSSGGFASVAGTSLSFTIGELAATETFTAGSTILTQGFQQPQATQVGILNLQGEDGYFGIYPNPVNEGLFYTCEFPDAGSLSLTITDVVGKVVSVIPVQAYESGKFTAQLPCSNYAAGSYFLNVRYVSANYPDGILLTKKFEIIH
jgi:hypothetical protein